MGRGHLAMLFGLALTWGASFMFIKVAVRELTPATLILGRLGLAALTLALVVPFSLSARRTLAEMRENWAWLAAVALVNTAEAVAECHPDHGERAEHHNPGWKVIGSVVALGVPGTALAYLLFFAMIAGAGAAFASLVTYLIPPIALAYGSIFLGERFGAAAFGGLALILGGVALGTGVVNTRVLRRRLASEA